MRVEIKYHLDTLLLLVQGEILFYILPLLIFFRSQGNFFFFYHLSHLGEGLPQLDYNQAETIVT
jgi:hypothetical protein